MAEGGGGATVVAVVIVGGGATTGDRTTSPSGSGAHLIGGRLRERSLCLVEARAGRRVRRQEERDGRRQPSLLQAEGDLRGDEGTKGVAEEGEGDAVVQGRSEGLDDVRAHPLELVARLLRAPRAAAGRLHCEQLDVGREALPATEGGGRAARVREGDEAHVHGLAGPHGHQPRG